ncbi:hypothetical protein X474_12480 [Dethiosulfatarculus sandiegensis]|uniref:Uncharacterized protein n=1 Tax=Dethiosulfatarculus sandiegensis TaxID=1429043 RepID=A0A0D2JEA0_9BACT|nr:hypothetical protein X474_12480 [Dethiosulfatarculus sandiegensis]
MRFYCAGLLLVFAGENTKWAEARLLPITGGLVTG